MLLIDLRSLFLFYDRKKFPAAAKNLPYPGESGWRSWLVFLKVSHEKDLAMIAFPMASFTDCGPRLIMDCWAWQVAGGPRQ